MAVNAFETLDGLAHTHDFQQGTHALTVAMATSHDLNRLDGVVGHINDHQF